MTRLVSPFGSRITCSDEQVPAMLSAGFRRLEPAAPPVADRPAPKAKRKPADS